MRTPKACWKWLHQQADSLGLPEIVTAREFLAADVPAPDELIAGVLRQGSKIILGGASKTYKTWTLIDLAVSVAAGSPWLGFETKPGKVLYVNLEIQPAFFRHRIQHVIDAKEVDLNGKLELWNLRGFAADYRELVPKIKDEAHALVILDPTYQLLGMADENSATDISALLNSIESLAVSTGAAVAMAGHFSKGNASAKETIDRISGSGVFAFTKLEEEGAFAVEAIFRNFPPVKPFVVKWDWPLFRPAESLDPADLKTAAGRPKEYAPETLVDCLGDDRLATGEWEERCRTDEGISRARFYHLRNTLKKAGKIHKSKIDKKWERVREMSHNYETAKDQ